jgi:sugar phosphate isomerase/epimerase
MTDQHPITPPPELVREWATTNGTSYEDLSALCQNIATQAARWGADQELDACCDWLEEIGPSGVQLWGDDLREDRRPKPPSLKEQAMDELDGIAAVFRMTHGGNLVCDTIRRALEQLDD